MGRRSPHGFKTQKEYMDWYCEKNRELLRKKAREYYRNNREEILRKLREKNALNKKPRKKTESKSYKWLYKITDGKVQAFKGIARGAEELHISIDVIKRAFKKCNGYCKLLDCWFVKSKDKLSDDEVLSLWQQCL